VNKTIRTVIIDDESEAREIIYGWLKNFKEFSVVGEAESVEEGIQQIKKNNPDLVLLDVEIPPKTGFQLVEEINRNRFFPHIIFISGKSEYALQAIKITAFDFIVKPLTFIRFSETILEFLRKKSETKFENNIEKCIEAVRNKIYFETNDGFIFIQPSDIVYFESIEGITYIQMIGNKKEIIHATLIEAEILVKDHNFFKLNRSLLINLKYLTTIDKNLSCCILEKVNERYIHPVTKQMIRDLESAIK
jgi:two-component system LytT family response regulator